MDRQVQREYKKWTDRTYTVKKKYWQSQTHNQGDSSVLEIFRGSALRNVVAYETERTPTAAMQ